MYDLRKISSSADYIIRDRLMEILITNFIEVYNGLESMLSIVEVSEELEVKPQLVKAKNLMKKILKNFKLVIFDTLKDGKIKEYLYVQYVFRFTFLNIISLAFLIKELYALMLTSYEKDKATIEDKANKKGKVKPNYCILNYSPEKQLKFDRAMVMYSNAFNSSKNKATDIKEQKDERYQTAFLTELSTYCNLKDPNYKAMSDHFTECFKKLDEGCIFTPLGINNIHVRVSPENIGSLIGFSLTSNIYFDGLVYFNYLNLKNKLLVQRESLKVRDEEENIIYLTEDETDVFNSPVPAFLIEKELQKSNKENFIFTFCNYKYHDVKMYVELDGEKAEFTKSQNMSNFYSDKANMLPKVQSNSSASKTTKYFNKTMSQEFDEERRQIDSTSNHLENYPYDYLKLEQKTPENLLEFLGILSSEYNKGTERLLKTLKTERDG